MKLINRMNPVLSVVSLIIAVVALTSWCFAYQQSTEHETELIIEDVAPCTIGVIDVRYNGEKEYQYIGEIKILNDGSNGEQIKIRVDQEDNLK